MNVLYYVPPSVQESPMVQRMVASVPRGLPSEVFPTVAELSGRLRRPSDGPLIAVLFAAAVGHTLSPRFIAFGYDTGEEAEVVFHHMLKNALKKELREKWSER